MSQLIEHECVTGTYRITLAPTGRHPIDVDVMISGAVVVGDLLPAFSEAIGQPWGDDVWLEHRRFFADTALEDFPLEDGVTVSPDPPGAPNHQSVVELRGVAGLESGRHVRLGVGRFEFGANPHAVTVTVGEDARITVTPSVGRSVAVNGRARTATASVAAGDTVQLGATAWQVAPAPAAGHPIQSHVFNRPPRTPPPELPGAVEPPSRDKVRESSRSFRIAMVIAPLLMGGIMVVVFKRWFYAIFMLMSPVVMGMNVLDDRLRRRKGSRRAEADFRKSVAEFASELEGWRKRLHVAAGRRNPDLADIVRRALEHDGRVWERRPHHSDFLRVVAGYGSRPLISPVALDAPIEPEVADLLARPVPGGSLPIEIDLRSGEVVGVTGPRRQAQRLAQALVVQAAVGHGPADLSISVICSPTEAEEWTWVSWLPHTLGIRGRRLLAAGEDDVEIVLNEIRSDTATQTLIILDGWFTADRANLVGELTNEVGASLLVLANATKDLPSVTSTIIETTHEVAIAVSRPSTGDRLADVTGVFTDSGVAADVARSLIRLDDPERETWGGSLPDAVGLLDLLGMPEPNAAQIAAAWAESGRTISSPIGATETGVLEIDLVKDGPHGLLAGTTGAGKSELLRSLVAGLAARVDPEHLNFVLIDYKGGSAFDVCANLPHVTGLVTDLDAHLGKRALICLEAELEYREHRLRDAGASDIPAYLDLGLEDPLPRLFIVIDEFAAMAKDMPEFMDALVDIAARGRSLGVHILLATQRPAGVIKDNVRANTNLRMALRVQDVSDSKDVLGDPAAAALPRAKPGRGYVRFGPSELVGFQTALVTGTSGATVPHLDVYPVRFGPDRASVARPVAAPDAVTDLDRLVEAIEQANLETGMRPTRSPWPPALDPGLGLHALLPSERGVVLGMVDEPNDQRQRPFVWHPEDGNLALYGMSGTGAEATAETAIRSIAATYGQDQAHVFVVAFGTHRFDDAAELPHVAAPVGPEDSERRERLIGMLGRELKDRRQNPDVVAIRPKLFLVVEDVAGLRQSLEPFHLAPLMDVFGDILAKGPSLGIHTIVTAYRAAALPMRMNGLFLDRLVFAFADPSEAAAFGFKVKEIPALPFAGALDARSGHVVQVATHYEGVPVRHSDQPTKPPEIPVMPTQVEAASLGSAEFSLAGWRVPVGVGGADLGVLFASFEEGDHLAVTGQSRSGKSTALSALAAKIAEASDHQLVAITPRKSLLRGMEGFKYQLTDMAEVAGLAQALGDLADERVIVFVDDAEMVDAPALDALLAARKPNLHFVVALRSGEAGRLYGHWSRRVRESRKGIVLQPEPGDGELFGAKLPKTTRAYPPGRGYLIGDGSFHPVHLAGPLDTGT